MSHRVGQKWLIRGQELPVGSPIIMGILNVTPDSFSDGGKFLSSENAFNKAKAMLDEGATIIDVGGESTRPGSQSISAEDQISRVLPIIEQLSAKTNALVSIDTQKAVVAKAAIKAGAHIVNDISAGRHDESMFEVVARFGTGYILMHMLGTPDTMQLTPHYEDVIADINMFFRERISSAVRAGVDEEQIVLDPGIGFGKNLEDNLRIMSNMASFDEPGRPLLLGASRKSFIGMIDNSTADKRIGGSLAAVISSYLQGVKLFRVHDVDETRQLIDIFTAIQKHSD